ncbi:hypothetical protein PTKIN_Ptkin06aG0046600 [Pterospermum kingtungense]
MGLVDSNIRNFKRDRSIRRVSKKKKSRIVKKRVNRIVYGKDFSEGISSEASLSDEDIMNRNKLIVREAEVNWEVGATLGFNFGRNQIQMVEMFDQLHAMIPQGMPINLGLKLRSTMLILDCCDGCEEIAMWDKLNLKCGIGNIYAPNDDVERECFCDELTLKFKDLRMPWCLAGDFNVVRKKDEKIGLSLDRFLVAPEFLELMPNLAQKLWPCSLFDLNLISLECEDVD